MPSLAGVGQHALIGLFMLSGAVPYCVPTRPQSLPSGSMTLEKHRTHLRVPGGVLRDAHDGGDGGVGGTVRGGRAGRALRVRADRRAGRLRRAQVSPREPPC